MKTMFPSRGVTLLEILLVLAIFGIIFAVGAPVYQQFKVRSDLSGATAILAQSYRRAATLAIGVASDSVWGVRADPGLVTIFKGTSYAVRDVSVDEIYTLPTSISFAGLTELTFKKVSGQPFLTGDTILSSSGYTRTVNINAKGRVEY